MNAIIRSILFYAAIILYGCICGFFMVLNWIKQEERRKEQNNGKHSK